MVLTGFKTQEEREARTREYYNSLKKGIQLNTRYEEAMNSAKTMNESGISIPPPPEENIDKETADASLQRQRAFASIKEILKNHDQAIKFLTLLDDSEIVPFNRYIAKFKDSVKGIDVKDADFLINLWDSFKKKVLLKDKDVPILGTELEAYKNELQKKGLDIVSYAEQIGLNKERIKSAVDQMVNNNDSAALDKFYFNLLSKGPQVANVILKEDFKAGEERPTLVEEVVPEEAMNDYTKELNKAEQLLDDIKTAIIQLLYRDTEYRQAVDFGVRSVNPRILDITKPNDKKIIKNHLSFYLSKVKELESRINKIRRLLGLKPEPEGEFVNSLTPDEDILRLIPNFNDYRVKREPEETKALTEEKIIEPIAKKFDLYTLSESDFNNLAELYEADAKTIKNIILQFHPDGKFTFNGVKYNLNRNPPTLLTQKEYLLQPFYSIYKTDISINDLFNELSKSPLYSVYKNKKIATELIDESEPYDEKIAELEREAEIERNEREEKEFIKKLKSDAKKTLEKAFTIAFQYTDKYILSFVTGIKDILYKLLKSSNLKTTITNDEILKALGGDLSNPSGIFLDNTPVQVERLIEMVINKFRPSMDRYIKVLNEYNRLKDKINGLTNTFKSLPSRKERVKARKKLEEAYVAFDTAEDFLKKNKLTYENVDSGVKSFLQNIGELSLFLNDKKITTGRQGSYDMNMVQTLLRPIEAEYDTIQRFLNDRNVFIPDFNDEIDRFISDSQPYEEPVLKEKLFVNVPRRKQIPLYERGFDEEKKGGEITRPIRKKLKSTAFGKYDISMRALGSGVLDIRTPCNRTSSKLPRTPISSRLEKNIKYVLENNDIDLDLFEKLTNDEKKLFIHAIESSDVKLNTIPFEVFKKFSSNDIQKELDELIDRYYLLTGQLGAGNNAPEILRELKGIIFKLLEKKKIDRVYANELLLLINSVN